MSAGAEAAPDKGAGWLIYAGVVMFVGGAINVVDGVAAITDARFYVHKVAYIVGSLHVWGWVHLVLGALLICTVFGLWAAAPWARWTGIVLAALNLIGRLLFLPAYPMLSVALIGIDLLVIYGLAVHGASHTHDHPEK